MPAGELLGEGAANSVTAPAVVIRPTWAASYSVNQSFPSGPAAMPSGQAAAVLTGNSLIFGAAAPAASATIPATPAATATGCGRP
jgi:hypothetical protein